jgi:hypothetical protein
MNTCQISSSARSRRRHVSKSSRNRPTSLDTASFDSGPPLSSRPNRPLIRRLFQPAR